MMIRANGRNRVIAVILAAVLLLSLPVPALAETFSAIVTSSGMAVYSNAALSYRLGTLPQNTVVRVTAYSGNVARITYAGRTGYASVSDMAAVDAVATKAVVNAAAKVYQSASTSSRSAVVKAGTGVYILATANGWAQVEKDGVVGYMYVNMLTQADDNWETATTQQASTIYKTFNAQAAWNVAVYQGASTSSARLGTLYAGQVVTVTAYNSDGWACVTLNGRTGYCLYDALAPVSASAVESTPTPAPAATAAPTNSYNAISGTVTASVLPVYQSASTASRKLGNLRYGQVVNVLQWNGTWAYIELSGHYGYCAVKGLTRTDAINDLSPTIAPTATPSVENAAKGTVTVASLAVYATASTSSTRLGHIYKGQVVNVLNWNSVWAYIELDGRYGFCAVKGLSRTDNSTTPEATPTPSTDNAVKATVITTTSVYGTASTSGAAIGTIRQGWVVNVLSVSGSWAYIELSGHYGFCPAAALSTSGSTSGVMPSGYTKGGFTATVVYPGARIYASASTGAQSTSIALGSTVNVYAYTSEWACVVSGANYAFIPVQQLSKAAYTAINSDGAELQTLLKALLSYGYYDGVPSTSYNSAAISAIKLFQAACGLTQTGVADVALQRILYSGYAPACSILSTTLQNGSKGSNVTRMQTRLYVLGYLSKTGSVDGDYGSTTANAVTLFQTANGISASGKADPATLKALYSTGAVAKPSNVKAADEITTVSSGTSVSLSSTYTTTMPAALASNTTSYSASSSNAEKLEYVIYNAQQQLGKPYVYGSTGPNSYDCSGLTTYAFKKIGISLKRSAYAQGYDTTYEKIATVGELKRGDLVFFNTISDSDLSDHAGIYLGGGCFIHASSGGKKVVVSNLTTGYYNRVFSWGRRVLH